VVLGAQPVVVDTSCPAAALLRRFNDCAETIPDLVSSRTDFRRPLWCSAKG